MAPYTFTLLDTGSKVPLVPRVTGRPSGLPTEKGGVPCGCWASPTAGTMTTVNATAAATRATRLIRLLRWRGCHKDTRRADLRAHRTPARRLLVVAAALSGSA